ncbi:MAG: enoyl-CoA hydratase/isomerase family protein, partial [Chrysiogenetes bacterium]|nr:enoyl-CoA hydratase/isomerase family protein [Chrysiogenetes bacterium]
MKELAGGRVLIEELAPYITRITLNDPDRRNALDLEMLGALDAELKELAGSEIRALILTGAGRAFCAGFNIGR